MSHKKLEWIRDMLVCTVETELGDLEAVDTCELGEVIDMIKDLNEAIYYETVTNAMNEQEWAREVNLNSLRQNGTIFFIRRDLDLLSRDGRPLSQGATLEEMYKKRLPLYLTFADYTVDNGTTVKECAEAIANIFFTGGTILKFL